MQTKKLLISEFGNPKKCLNYVKEDIRSLSGKKVLIKMIYAPINPSDLIPIIGGYSHRIQLPYIPGYEGVGTIIKIGKEVDNYWIRKRVLAINGEGTWQTHVITNQRWLINIPDNITNLEAAQLFINPITALVLIQDILKLNKSSTLFMNAGKSELSKLFCQLSKEFNFNYIEIARNLRLKTELTTLGAEKVILESSIVPSSCKEGTKKQIAIDCVGGESSEYLACLLQSSDRLLQLGLLSGIPLNAEKIKSIVDIPITLFHLRHWILSVTELEWKRKFDLLLHLIQQDKLSISKPSKIVPFESLLDTLDTFSQDQQTGKVLLSFK